MKCLTQSEFNTLFAMIKTHSSKGFIPEFRGKHRIYDVVTQMVRRLKPKSYLGWADSDSEIGNIKDI